MNRNGKRNAIAAAGALVIVLTVWSLTDRSPPVEFTAGEIDPPEIVAGQQATVKRSVKWLRLCPYTIQPWFTDSQRVVWKLATVDLPAPPKLETVNSRRPLSIPQGLPTGRAEYHVTVLLRCGIFDAWWPIKVDAPVLTFTVK